MMKRNKFSIHIFICTLVLAAAVGCSNNTERPNKKEVVAEIDGVTKITFKELSSFYDNLLFHKRYPDSRLLGYKAALQRLIEDRRKQIDFIKSGMHKDSALTGSMRRTINEEIVVEYFNEEYLSNYINDNSIENYYEGMAREVEYRQIFIKKPANAPAAVLDSLKNEVMQIRDELAGGASFSEMVREYSQHQPSKQKDGYMPPITWRESAESPLIRMVFRMKEGAIRAVENPNGYYIFEVEKVRKTDVPPLEDVRDKVVENMRQIYLDQALKEFESVKNRVLNEDSLEWNESALEQLTKWAKQPRFYEDHYQDTLKKAIADGNNFTILRYDGGGVDLKRYLKLLNDILIPGKTSDLLKNDLKNFIKEAVKTAAMVERARDSGITEDVLTINTPSNVIRSRYRDIYNQQKIHDRVPEPTEENLRKFYRQERDSTLYQLAKVSVYVKVMESEPEARTLVDQVRAGRAFTEAVNRRYKIKTFTKTRSGAIKGEDTSLAEKAFDMDEGEVSDPVSLDTENGTRYAVLKCVNKLEQRPLEYNEVPNIEKKFRKYHVERLSRKVNRDLKKKYPATIYDEVLEQKVAELGDQ